MEAAAKTLFENTPIVGNRSWQWCCDKLPALAEKWRVCARAAIAAYEQAMWRPIEEAKKDGTIIDVWLGDASESDVNFYCTDGTRRSPGWSWYRGKFRPCAGLDVQVPVFVTPTHYRPLPPRPGKEG